MIVNVVQRWNHRQDRYRPAGETIDVFKYEVSSIPDDTTAKKFVVTHHYSGSFPAARVRVGLYCQNELVGVAVFSQPANDLALRPLPGSAKENVELGRFVLLDSVPANGETFFLARAFEILRREGFAGVVSFSDPMPRTSGEGRAVFGGHVGTIYQAFNGVYLGRSRPGSLRLLPDGRVMHNRSLAKIRKMDRGWRYAVEQLVDAGAPPILPDEEPRLWVTRVTSSFARTVKHPGNHKYVWGLNRASRKSLPSTLPYPKLGRTACAA